MQIINFNGQLTNQNENYLFIRIIMTMIILQIIIYFQEN